MSTTSTPITARTAPPLEAPSLLTERPPPPGHRRFDADLRRDLLYDTLVSRLTRNRDGYRLEEWFTSPATATDIGYRHDVFRDLARPEIRTALSEFAEAVQRARGMLEMTRRLHYDVERQRWFLEAALRYTAALRSFADDLGAARPRSTALRSVGAWLADHTTSPAFTNLVAEAHEVAAEVADVRYRLRVHDDRIEVRAVDPDEPDYAEDVLDTFRRFRQGAGSSYLKDIRHPGTMDHVEAAIAGFLVQLHPRPFAALRAFTEHHQPLVPESVLRLEREAQFYLAYLTVMDDLADQGLPCTLPDLDTDGRVEIRDGYDVVLALGSSGRPTVSNSCRLAPEERLLVVTGPNQGGKTTYARMLGQLHLLATLGVPVPARQARLPLADRIVTLFERGENLADQHGHLQDDLLRARAVVDEAGPQTLVLLNEVFSSTTLEDSLFLARDLLGRLGAANARCVCVTFLDELTTLTPSTVSMVAGVDPDDSTRRTYRVERRPADGLAYAHALAERHGLTREALTRRMQR